MNADDQINQFRKRDKVNNVDSTSSTEKVNDVEHVIEDEILCARLKKYLFELVAIINSLKNVMDIAEINYDDIGKVKLNELILVFQMVSRQKNVNERILEMAIEQSLTVCTGIIQNIGTELKNNGDANEKRN